MKSGEKRTGSRSILGGRLLRVVGANRRGDHGLENSNAGGATGTTREREKPKKKPFLPLVGESE